MRNSCIVMFAALAALGSAQTFTGRYSEVHYDYVFGAGGDAYSDNQTVIDTAAAPFDSESLDFSDSRMGNLFGTPWTAGVDASARHNYLLVDSPSYFEIFVQGTAYSRAHQTGPGLAVSNVYSTFIGYFDLASTREIGFVADLDVDPGGGGLGNRIALQRFDGFAWQTLHSTWDLPGAEGYLSTVDTLTAGQYRLTAEVGSRSYGNESYASQFTAHVYTANAVPEPTMTLAAVPVAWIWRGLRRRRAQRS